MSREPPNGDGTFGDPLFDLASAISDGRSPAWKTAEGEQRRVVEALREISQIAEVHRSFQGQLAELGRELEPGETWGPLEIVEKVGEGAYADVYRARDVRLDRIVALKLLRGVPSHLGANDEAVIEEGRLLARVSHRNVVTVYGAEPREGRIGIWTEFVEGRTLGREVAQSGPLGAREAAAVGVDLCRALAAVHAQGVIHRDVKAQNVMRDADGRVLLMDFGVGRDVSAEEVSGKVTGTPLYLAPEVAAGEPATERSDLYAVSVLLYHLVSGEFPVRGASLEELRRVHAAGGAKPLAEAAPHLPPELESVVERGLAGDPKKRWPSAEAMGDALQNVLESLDRRPPLSAAIAFVERPLMALVVLAVFALGCFPGPEGHNPARTFFDELTTSSPEALRDFEKAVKAQSKSDSGETVRRLEKVVEEDPEFAVAWAYLGMVVTGEGNFEDGWAALETGHDLISELEPKGPEHHYVDGYYRLSAHQYYDAIDAFEKFRLSYPDQDDVLRQLAFLYSYTDQWDLAIKTARAAEAATHGALNAGLVAVFQARAGRPEDAWVQIGKARRRLGDEPYFYWGEGLAHLYADDVPPAREAFEELRRGGVAFRSQADLFLAQSQIYEGDLLGALYKLESSQGLDMSQGYDETLATRRHWAARLHLISGHPVEAARWIEDVVDLPVLPTHLPNFRDAAVILAELGELEEARFLLAKIEDLSQRYPSPLSEGMVAQVRGEIARAEGDLEGAAAALTKMHWNDPSTLRSKARFRIGRERFDQAVPVLEDLLEMKGEILEVYPASLWVLAHLDLARCRRALGETGEARESYLRFLELWGNSKAPEVAEARRELEELAAD